MWYFTEAYENLMETVCSFTIKYILQGISVFHAEPVAAW